MFLGSGVYWPHVVSGSRDSVQKATFRCVWGPHRFALEGHLLTCFAYLSVLGVLAGPPQLACHFGLYKHPYPWGEGCTIVRENIGLVCTKPPLPRWLFGAECHINQVRWRTTVMPAPGGWVEAGGSEVGLALRLALQ